MCTQRVKGWKNIYQSLTDLSIHTKGVINVTCIPEITKGIKKKKKHKNRRIYLRIRGRKIAKNLLDYALDNNDGTIDQRAWRLYQKSLSCRKLVATRGGRCSPSPLPCQINYAIYALTNCWARVNDLRL